MTTLEPTRIDYDPASEPDYGLDLIDELDHADRWPTLLEQPIQERLSEWASLREGDADVLRSLVNWNPDRSYVVDPLAGKISEAFSSLIFGKDPIFTPANEADQDGLTYLIEQNSLPSELQRAAEISSSEGEVWWRVYVDRDIARCPQLQFYSRRFVYPLFRYKRLLACGFVSEFLPTRANQIEVFRHIEVHSEGMVRNVLFQGNQKELGHQIDLKRRSETQDLVEEWNHGLGMMAGRIPNKLGTRPELGVSDYSGVRELLLALNETATIGAENARLTAKKRLFVSSSLTDAEGNFDAGADVIQFEQMDEEAGTASGKPPVQAVEYSFDAAALVLYKNDLADNILTRTGVAPQLAGRDTGSAMSGTALRSRMLHSELISEGKARYWDDDLPEAIMLMQILDNLPEEQGGFGRPWSAPGERPAIQRADAIPQDPAEETFRHATLVGAQLESKKTAIQALHPEWSEEQVQAEVDQIAEELFQELNPQPEAGFDAQGNPTTPGAPAQGPGQPPAPGQKGISPQRMPERSSERFMFNTPT